jgi:hypothetical protein
MIFLEISLFWHYVFAVVQKSSSPTHPGGNPPSIWHARARRRQGIGCTHPFSRKRRKTPSQPGRLRHFLNRVPFHPSEQQPYNKFSYYYHSTSSFLCKIFQKSNLQVIGIQSLVKMIRLIVVPLQGTVFGWVPHPRLKPGVKHGEAPTAQSIVPIRPIRPTSCPYPVRVKSVSRPCPVRVKSVSRPCPVRVGCGRSVRAKPVRVFRG